MCMEEIELTEAEKDAVAKGVRAVLQEVKRRLGEEHDGLDRVSSYCPPELRYDQRDREVA